MKPKRLGSAVMVAAALLSAGIVLGSTGSAAADDYTVLLVDPNVVVDTLAYTPGATTMNPGGQPGAARIFSHRDGRTITDTVWVLADPAAATAAVTQAQSAAGIVNPKSEQVEVGSGGQVVTGTSVDGSQSLSLLSFTQGNVASTIQFSGPANDPAPTALAVELGQAQDALIKNRQGG